MVSRSFTDSRLACNVCERSSSRTGTTNWRAKLQAALHRYLDEVYEDEMTADSDAEAAAREAGALAGTMTLRKTKRVRSSGGWVGARSRGIAVTQSQ